MRPVSSGLAAAVLGSHRMAARARVVAPGQSGTDPDGTVIPIEDGDVQYDATADIRATLDLTTDGTGWDPRPGAHTLQPYGNEIFVERGVEVSAGSIEWVSQGYYRIYEVEQDDAPSGPLRIAGRDRMSAIVDGRLTSPRQFKKAQMASAVITQLVQEVLPSAVVEFTATDQALGRDQVAEDDRRDFLQQIVDSLGAVWFFDYRGVLVVKPAPSLNAAPAFEVNAGPGGVLVSASRSISRDGVYNAVIASGEGADDTSPARAIAYDGDPSSPTYWNGPFGQVPEFYSSPLITTKASASAAAYTRMLKVKGLPYNVDLTAVPHPGLEPYDVIGVRYPGFSERHILDKLTIPLTAKDTMAGTTRAQTTTQIGVG